MKEIIDIVHKSILPFFDVCEKEEEPLTEKDKLLLKVNKAICNNLKALEQEQKTRWIPVSEKLPEETDPYINVLPTDVLVWEKYYSYKAEDFVEGYNIGWFWNGNWSVYGGGQSEVLAWMPLPDPYKAESGDKNADSN